MSPVALSNRLQLALYSIAPPPDSGNSPLGPQEAARYLLAGHHPRTTMARACPFSVWYVSVIRPTCASGQQIPYVRLVH